MGSEYNNKTNPADLVDICDVKIDSSLPPAEKLKSYLDQIKNPYLFRVGKIVVKVSYANTSATLEDRLEQFIRQRKASDVNTI